MEMCINLHRITEIYREAYFEALRAYKGSDHSVVLGWFDNWSGTGASFEILTAA